MPRRMGWRKRRCGGSKRAQLQLGARATDQEPGQNPYLRQNRPELGYPGTPQTFGLAPLRARNLDTFSGHEGDSRVRILPIHNQGGRADYPRGRIFWSRTVQLVEYRRHWRPRRRRKPRWRRRCGFPAKTEDARSPRWRNEIWMRRCSCLPTGRNTLLERVGRRLLCGAMGGMTCCAGPARGRMHRNWEHCCRPSLDFPAKAFALASSCAVMTRSATRG